MRTELALLASLASGQAVAGTPSDDPSRFTLGVAVEVAAVGFGVGVHPELLYRPAAPDGWFNLRFALGVIPGPELTNLPLSVGLRAVAEPRRIVRPWLGLGAKMQVFVPYGAPVSPRLDIYFELGFDVQVASQWHVGLDLSAEFGMVPAFGLGATARVGFRYDFGPAGPPRRGKRAASQADPP